jgi:curved DNA-binding protein
MSHYDTLGLHKGATPDEIKKAYRKLASQHHPDKGGDTAMFQKVEEAYRTLSDPDKRAEYDNPPQQQFHFQNGGTENIHDLFKNFGFHFDFHNPHQHQQPRRNKDLKTQIHLPLDATLEDQKKFISVQTTNGHRETVEVSIPRGVTTGIQIKYPGLGDNLFETLQRGDLIIEIVVQPANGFTSNGIDLQMAASVNCLLAITGGEVNITGLDGKEFLLTIPPGTQPGIKFRIAKQGLYEMNSTNRGDLYVTFGVTIPTNLTEEQINSVRSILITQ